MTKEKIKELIADEVKTQLKAAKEELAERIEREFSYTGEFTNTEKLIEVFRTWART
jgi:ribosomal protein L29